MSTEKLKLMICEDEVGMLELYVDILGDIFNIATAKDAEEGLKVAAQFQPHMVLTDLNMGYKGDGLVLLKKLKEHDDDILVVLITAFADKNVAIDALRNRAYGFIEKPFEVEDLLPVLSQAGSYRRLKLDHDRTKVLLETSEKRFRDISCAIGEFIWEVDNEWRFTFVGGGEGFFHLLGYTNDSLIGKTFFDLASPESQEKLRSTLVEIAAKEGNIVDAEIECLTKTDNKITVARNGIPIKGENGKVLGYRGVDKNITERKNVERMQHEILMQSDKLASIGALCAGIAHELSNPLTFIQGYAEKLIREHGDSPPQVKIGEDIKTASKRMVSIISHLRQFTRKSTTTDWKAVNVNDVIRDSLIILAHRVKTAKVKMSLHLCDALPGIWGDPNQLESIFQNLMVNSMDAFEGLVDKTDREIQFITTAKDGGVHIHYKDNAGGMPDKVRERIFEAFYTTKPAGKGTGLGMSITKGIVDQHKGTISVESQQGIGTMFFIFFPQMENQEQEKKAAEVAAVRVEPMVKFSEDKPGLLIIDNDEKVCTMLGDFLGKRFNVKTLNHAGKGLSEVKSKIYDAILVNFMMPEVSGLDIAAAAKETQPHTPILIMSDFEWKEKSIQNAKRNGVTDIIKKPFESMESLSQKIAASIKR